MRTIANYGLLALLVAALLANLALRRDPAQANIDILPDMVQSAAYASFSPNPILPGGKPLQTPVPGTLPRGFERMHYTSSPEDAVRAGKELRSPVDATAASARGEVVYRNFCTPCHGAQMRGDGAVVLRGYPAPPNLTAGKSLELTEGQMFHILTFGQKNMPSHASQLDVRDRWSVIAYMRAAQEAAVRAASATPPTPVEEAKP